MSGGPPFFAYATGPAFPVQFGQPVLISEDEFRGCCCGIRDPVTSIAVMTGNIDDDIRVDINGRTVIDRQRTGTSSRSESIVDGQDSAVISAWPVFAPVFTVRLAVGDSVDLWAANVQGAWSTASWTATVTYASTRTRSITGGLAESGGTSGAVRFPVPDYHWLGRFVIPNAI